MTDVICFNCHDSNLSTPDISDGYVDCNTCGAQFWVHDDDLPTIDIKLNGIGIVEHEYVPVCLSSLGDCIGVVLVPVDRQWLDVIDCPLTQFASDNGLRVDDIYLDED
jgi:hypothetical protein